MKRLIIGGLCLFMALSSCQKLSYDLIIINAQVYDGKGGEPKQVDVGIRGDVIAEVGDLQNAQATQVIDAKGLALAPGFIDLHAHIESIQDNPHGLSALHQGVTTVLGGPDGSSPYPMKPYMDELSGKELGLNAGFLVGHNTVRRAVMKLEDRAPTPEELQRMEQMIDTAMQQGAFGISTGLKYLPGAFSKVDEVIALSTVAAQKGGFYTSHLRDEGLNLMESVQEAIDIAHGAQIPVVLTHHKVVGKPSWGKSVQTLALVDSANQAGLDIQIDQYPYTASFTSISILIPAWARAGGQAKFKERMQDPQTKQKIWDETLFNILNDRGAGDIKNIQFSKVKWKPDLENKRLSDWAIERGLEPTPEVGADLVLEAQLNGGASMIFHAMDEADVRRIMQHPKTMVASDGRLSILGAGFPHPRAFGTFPRVLGHYVREEGVLSLEQAIHKMSYLPAQRMGLEDRGEIAVGKKADLVLFDPATVVDKASFTDPNQYPEGIEYVLVNGVLSIEDGKETGKYGGRVLRKNQIKEE